MMETALLNSRTLETKRSPWSHLKQTLYFTLVNHSLLTSAALIFIAAVSIHDTYLAVIEEEILLLEKNPICAALMRLDPDGLTFFILGKCLGNLIVIGALISLHRVNYAHANVVTSAVAAFQSFLLGYLYLSDPKLGGLPNFAVLFVW